MAFAIGLMSGTSLDGIDAALVEINGKNEETTVSLIHFITLPFSSDVVQRIKRSFSIQDSNSALLSSLNVELGYLSADAVRLVCKEAGFSLDAVDFVASHGQTIYHIPNSTEDLLASTFQIGESAVICEEVKTTVISDFRTRDMAVGGQGAPIVPYSEYILYRSSKNTRLLQNIGGIGNVTVIPVEATLNDLIAFDTGPGNMVMNELMQRFFQESYDKDGEHAALGTVNEQILSRLMDHPYLKRPVPKTTGREVFGKEFVDCLLQRWNLDSNDWIATATMYTARTIANSVKPYLTEQTDLIVGGGGSYNKTLMEMIQFELLGVNVLTQEDIGYSSEAKEAIAMTILGNQTLHHMPSNVMAATGAKKPVILGKITFYA